ncbi:hypothetical protein I3760_05G039700 [Carya illinoinensis]|nr:hypothetical protein I3760_05G039700 [Carya illinoinensis]
MASNVHLTDDEYDEVFVDDGPDNYDGTEEPKEDDGVEEPIVGRTFSSEEEVRSYYMRYAKQKGFGVRRRNSRQSEDGRVRWFTLNQCSSTGWHGDGAGPAQGRLGGNGDSRAAAAATGSGWVWV